MPMSKAPKVDVVSRVIGVDRHFHADELVKKQCAMHNSIMATLTIPVKLTFDRGYLDDGNQAAAARQAR